MLDFLKICTRTGKNETLEIYPKFVVKPTTDLMIRGGDFYAIWNEETKLWSMDEFDALQMIDRELDIFAEKKKDRYPNPRIQYMWDSESGMVDKWHRYCQKQMRDSFTPLDESLIFSNTETKKEDYASKKLPYPIAEGDISSYEVIMSTLYSESERMKLEWAIGAIVVGDSKWIQKFIVLYGSPGTGKSTVLNIIQDLFEGYFSVIDAKALGSASNAFALDAFRSNPLVAIQHDSDLSRIEDNARLNSLISHEMMTVNEKFKPTYTSRFISFLFIGTNSPVKITDSKSGLLRRLIDVSPSGNKLSFEAYNEHVRKVKFELGAIAHHCKHVYLNNKDYYNDYIPTDMMGASNDFYNFILDSYDILDEHGGVTLKSAWELYKNYCVDANIKYPLTKRVFKEELKNYFKEYDDRKRLPDGTQLRNYYSKVKFGFSEEKPVEVEKETIEMLEQESIFDQMYKDAPAQYANEEGTPTLKWASVKSKLSDLDSGKVHYVRVPENHIVIDFDIVGADGEKSLERNLEEASKWPTTYGELSKSGKGVHLHYIYDGDVTKLSRVYDHNVEVKVFTGNGALRRRLTKCNDIKVRTINSGLPLKGDGAMVKFDAVKNEQAIRTLIKKNLNKEYHASTKSSIDFIFKILEDAYSTDLIYDVSDMRNAVLAFAANSTNKANWCIQTVGNMKFKSKEQQLESLDDSFGYDEDPLVFFDVEVFPNLFIVCFKVEGEDSPMVRLINPEPHHIEALMKRKLVGFNCRRYDNHILYARFIGWDNTRLYNLSQQIINQGTGFFSNAWNLSYTDAYCFASAGNKKSLKRWEIDLGIHHQELGLPWDKPVDESLWVTVAEYCDNDVYATEAVFNHLKSDWTARQILADLAGLTVNDTTNTLTKKIIFEGNRSPQKEFNYRDLSQPVKSMPKEELEFLKTIKPGMFKQKHYGYTGTGEESILPYFQGYEFKLGKSYYRDELVGEGGYVYAEPGIHKNVALIDVASMHPNSAIDELLFGLYYTKRFKELVDGRVSIKHESWSELDALLNGALKPYIQRVLNGEMTSKELSNALKTAINSVYGLTSARFANEFKDSRNVDNIVAKRGALFMIDLKHAVMEKGFTVAHIKTDSIKIPNATPEIIKFVMDFGLKYGYEFEHETTYEKMCLVNNAVYIAKDADGTWLATGKQFAQPYVFKTLFSDEPIEFDDVCETRSVSTALYLDLNENLPDVSGYEEELAKLESSTQEVDPAILENLRSKIKEGHDYHFVGKIGLFTPMLPGAGGGRLLRKSDKGYHSVNDTKDHLWMSSEMVEKAGVKDKIDLSYYRKLVDDAMDAISKYGDLEDFLQ